MGDGVQTEVEEAIEERAVVAEAEVNTIARFSVAGGVSGTVCSGGTIRAVGC